MSVSFFVLQILALIRTQQYTKSAVPTGGFAAPKTVWHPAPRGVSQMFPEDFFMPGH